jgi:branched-chain amino acid transport system ATP-binding protein
MSVDLTDALMTSRAPSASDSALLSVRALGVRFGGIVALDALSFDIHPGEICGLIGPNGAGKTTVFNCISRLCGYETGDILLEGRSMAGLRSHDLARRGVARTFQSPATFGTMSVLDNVMTGAHVRGSTGFLARALRRPSAAAEERHLRAAAAAIIDELDLGDVQDRTLGKLPEATQKRVDLARALASRPRLLLLDEPGAGSSPEELDQLAGFLRQVRDRFQMTILLVEHRMDLVMTLCDRIVVLDLGRKIADDLPARVRDNAAVVEAYLGDAIDA